MNDCPITDLRIVEQSAVESYTEQGYEAVNFNSTSTLIFSKNVP